MVCGIPAESENARVPSMTVLVILVECQAWLLEGHRDLVMEICCALHNFRVRLNPWLPMI